MTVICPTVIPREGWNAVPPNVTDIVKLKLPMPEVTLGQTNRVVRPTYEACKEELIRIQRAHMNDDEWADIGMK